MFTRKFPCQGKCHGQRAGTLVGRYWPAGRVKMLAAWDSPVKSAARFAGGPRLALPAQLTALRNGHKSSRQRPEQRSARYRLVYRAIADHIRASGVCPSQPQLKRDCGVSSNRVLEQWLASLEEDGKNIRRPGRRGLELLDEAKRGGDSKRRAR